MDSSEGTHIDLALTGADAAKHSAHERSIQNKGNVHVSALSVDQITEILKPFYPTLTPTQGAQLSAYLDLLIKWNGKMNLTSIRAPEQIVMRHFGESLFVAAQLPSCRTLLDLGSGAGFPGIPIQIALPALQVTLAESQGKKAAFLREVIRDLRLTTEVWSDRVEKMQPERQFDVVTLRAVDHPSHALALAWTRINPGGIVAHLTSDSAGGVSGILLPGAQRRRLHLLQSGTCSTWNEIRKTKSADSKVV